MAPKLDELKFESGFADCEWLSALKKTRTSSTGYANLGKSDLDRLPDACQTRGHLLLKSHWLGDKIGLM
jgi:hypothetical protein